MIKGVFIAFGIMVVSLLTIWIPLVHFVILASPFIGGYKGISSAGADSRSPMAKAITFGFLLGGLVMIISVPASAVLTAVADLGRFLWVLWGGVAIMVIYTASMSALGALFSLHKAGSDKPGPGPEERTSYIDETGTWHDETGTCHNETSTPEDGQSTG